MPSETQDESLQLSPKEGRSKSDALSMVSNEMDMIMDVPDDFDEAEFYVDNNVGGSVDGDDQDLRSDTLESSKRGSVASDDTPATMSLGAKKDQ